MATSGRQVHEVGYGFHDKMVAAPSAVMLSGLLQSGLLAGLGSGTPEMNMTDDQVKEGIRALVAEATGDALGVEVAGRNHEGTMQLTVRFTRELEKFNFLPLMRKLEPISECDYSNPFGEKS